MISWEVVITSAPRKEPTLRRCVESVIRAGWWPTIFAEPGTDVGNLEVPVVYNSERLGVWRNWKASIEYALERSPDAVLTIQDDMEFHPDSREFLEEVMWPRDTGYISLYTPSHYQTWHDGTPREPGLYEVETASMWGACALCFPTKVLQSMQQVPKYHNWLGVPPERKDDESDSQYLRRKNDLLAKRQANPWMIQNSDTVIGQLVRKSLKRRLYYINPSPSEHIATYSSCGHGNNTGKRNAMKVADHSIPLKDQVYGTTNQSVSERRTISRVVPRKVHSLPGVCTGSSSSV